MVGGIEVMAQERYRRNRGFALLTVIWALFILSALGLIVSQNAAILNRQQHASWDHLERKALAEAGFYRALFGYLVIDDPLSQRQVADGRLAEFVYRDRKATLSVEAETGKIDLNNAETALVGRAFEIAYTDPARSELLLNAVKRQKSAGQKLESLSLLEKPAVAAQARFPSTSIFTVYSDISVIDPATASEPALLSIPGMSETLAKQIVARRSQGSVPAEAAQFARYFGRGSQIYRINVSLGRRADFLSAVIDARPSAGTPRIISWRERF